MIKDIFDIHFFGGKKEDYKSFMITITDINDSKFLRRIKSDREERIFKAFEYFMQNNPKSFIRVCECDLEYLMDFSDCVHYLVLDKIVDIQIKEDKDEEEGE